MASEAADYRVVDAPGKGRFEIRAGERVAGFTEYRRSGGLIAFTHTEVDPELEGHGLGGRLIAAALDAAREQGLAVLPFCPFVRAYIAEHPDEYLDLVPEKQRAHFKLPADNDT